jgi:hypothetical protein
MVAMTNHAPASFDEAINAATVPNHAGVVSDVPHGAADEGEEGGHDDHADAEEPLGPIDVQAWGALIAGAALGLAVAFCIAISTSYLG